MIAGPANAADQQGACGARCRPIRHGDVLLGAEASRQTQAYGQEGWEIVGSSVQRVQVAHHFRDYDKGGDLLFEWSIVSTLKRPLPPG
jgi:hypothetical protein